MNNGTSILVRLALLFIFLTVTGAPSVKASFSAHVTKIVSKQYTSFRRTSSQSRTSSAIETRTLASQPLPFPIIIMAPTPTTHRLTPRQQKLAEEAEAKQAEKTAAIRARAAAARANLQGGAPTVTTLAAAAATNYATATTGRTTGATEAVGTLVSPTNGNGNDNINAVLTDLQSNTNNDGAPEEQMEEDTPPADGTASPVKKKKRRAKKPTGGGSSSRRNSSTASTATSGASSSGNKRDRGNGAGGTTRPATSVLQQGRFSAAQSTGKLVGSGLKFSDFAFHTILEGAVKLEDKDKQGQFIASVKVLMKNIAIVDGKAFIVPKKERSKVAWIGMENDVPENLTLMTEYMDIQGGGGAFKMKRNNNKKGGNGGGRRGNNNGGGGGEADMRDPIVNFQFAVCSQVEPETIVDRVVHEWTRKEVGGIAFKIKPLQCYNSNTPWMVMDLYNYGKQATLTYELQAVLEKARDLLKANQRLPDEFSSKDIPSTTWRRNVPKLRGQETQQFQDYSDELQQCRKVLHVEVDVLEGDMLNVLMEAGKEFGLFADKWGKWVHPTRTTDWNTDKCVIDRLIPKSQEHTNFNYSMTQGSIPGITNVNAEAPVYESPTSDTVVASISLRQLLYTAVKTLDGDTLFAEIHQDMLGGDITVVYPNTPAHEKLVEMMRKHVSGYLWGYLQNEGVDERVYKKLFEKGMNPTLVHEATQCHWNHSTFEVTLPGELEEDAKSESVTQNGWYVDVVGQLTLQEKTKQNGNKKYADPEMCFNLDGDRSIGTIHQANDGKYQQVEVANVLQLGRGRQSSEEDAASDEDEGSVTSTLTGMDKDQLLEYCRKHRETLQQPEGSQPSEHDRDKSRRDGASDAEVMSVGSSSSSSYFDSDEEFDSAASVPSGGSRAPEAAANGA